MYNIYNRDRGVRQPYRTKDLLLKIEVTCVHNVNMIEHIDIPQILISVTAGFQLKKKKKKTTKKKKKNPATQNKYDNLVRNFNNNNNNNKSL